MVAINTTYETEIHDFFDIGRIESLKILFVWFHPTLSSSVLVNQKRVFASFETQEQQEINVHDGSQQNSTNTSLIKRKTYSPVPVDSSVCWTMTLSVSVTPRYGSGTPMFIVTAAGAIPASSSRGVKYSLLNTY